MSINRPNQTPCVDTANQDLQSFQIMLIKCGITSFLVILLLIIGCAGVPMSREEMREQNRYESYPQGAKAHFTQVRGKKIYSIEMGSGQPIVLIHGFPTSSYLWRHILPRLAGQYRVIAPDLVGYGKSEADPGADRSVPSQVAYLTEWMDQMRIDQAILVGQDIGGAIAQIIAVRFPEKVKGLVLINSACFDSWPYDYAKLLAEPGLGSSVGKLFTQKAGVVNVIRQGVYHQNLLTDVILSSYHEPWSTPLGKKNLALAAESLNNECTQVIANELGRIRVPTLVIAGRFDPFQSINYSKRLAASIPGAQFIQIPNCGHFAAEDEPEKISRYILDYFD